MSVKVTMNLWLVDFYQQPQTSHKKSMEHYNVKLFLVPIKHWCAIEMSRLRGSLRKRVHSTVFPHCVRAAYTHIHMKPKEKEWAVMLSSDIYLSNPISPIHTSPPRLSASHSPAGAACSCTFVKVKHAEAGERGERERKRWMAGEVSLMCAGPLALPDRNLTKLLSASQSTDKPLFGGCMIRNNKSQIFCLVSLFFWQVKRVSFVGKQELQLCQ